MTVQILLFTGLLSVSLMYVKLKDRLDALDAHINHFQKRMVESTSSMSKATQDSIVSIWDDFHLLSKRIDEQDVIQDLNNACFIVHSDRINDLQKKLSSYNRPKPKAKKKTKKS